MLIFIYLDIKFPSIYSRKSAYFYNDDETCVKIKANMQNNLCSLKKKKKNTQKKPKNHFDDSVSFLNVYFK